MPSEQIGPVQIFSVNTLPDIQTWAQPIPGVSPLYSGKFLLEPVDFGIVAVNLDSGTSQKLRGVSKRFIISQNPPLQYWPPATASVEIEGDCWNSVMSVAATPDNPKWVVASVHEDTCEFKYQPHQGERAEGLMVWSYSSGLFSFRGFIKARVNGEARLHGDTAYVRQAGLGTPLWTSFDLNTMMVGTTDIPDANVPPAVVQSDYQGYTYTLTFFKSLPSYPSPNMMEGTRVGGGNGEPMLPKFCPDKALTRKQVCAMIYNFGQYLKGANPGIVVPEYDGSTHFRDVPEGNIFKPAIDALALAGIVAGVPDDQSCD